MTEQNQFPAVFHGNIANQTQLLCNARELHDFLQSKQDFSTWIKNRIKKYGFLENQDFISTPQIYGVVRNEKGQFEKKRTDYHISLDMAKELAMVKNSDTGRKIRRYFIACEKELRQQQNLAVQALSPNYIQLLQAQIKLTQRQTGLRFWEIYQALNTFCGVSHYAQIPCAQFHQAIDFLLKLGNPQQKRLLENADTIARNQVKQAIKVFAERYATPVWVVRQDILNWFGLKNYSQVTA